MRGSGKSSFPGPMHKCAGVPERSTETEVSERLTLRFRPNGTGLGRLVGIIRWKIPVGLVPTGVQILTPAFSLDSAIRACENSTQVDKDEILMW